jgi:hypothetical protein
MGDYITIHINKVFAIRAVLFALAVGAVKLAYDRGETAGINLAFSYLSESKTTPSKPNSSNEKQQRLRQHSSDPTDRPYYFDEARRT